MQRRYVERFSLGTQSHFQAGSTKEQKSCLQTKRLCQTVPEAKENDVGAPDTISECRVTCYRVKRRYTKLSVFPAPIPVRRRSSPWHSRVADTGFHTQCSAWTPCLNPGVLQSSSHHLQAMVQEPLPRTPAAIYPCAE